MAHISININDIGISSYEVVQSLSARYHFFRINIHTLKHHFYPNDSDKSNWVRRRFQH